MRSIRSKLTVTMLLVCGLALAGVAFFVERSLRNRLVEEFDERLRIQALAITTVTKQEREYIEVAFNDRYLREFSDENPVKFYQFWSPVPFGHREGHKVRRSESLRRQDLPRQTGTLKEPLFWDFQLADGRPGRAIGIRYVPHADDWDRRRNFNSKLNLDLVVAEDRTPLDLALAGMRKDILTVGLCALPVVLLVVPVVVMLGLSPLRRLTRQVAEIDARNLGKRVPNTSLPIEIQPIAGGINSLLQRIEESFKRERRFSGDLAHELRTPIAELRSLAESHIAFPENDHELAKDAHEIALQMQSLVVKLLLLYRSEHGQLPVNPELIALQELVESLWQPHSEKTQRRGITFTNEVPPGAALITDRTLFTSLVRNLLDNAAEYTPLNGIIRVEYREAEGGFKFVVTNTAEILDPMDYQNMFDRFWRGDKARASGQHAGLGLAIVRSLAELLKYRVDASVSDGSRLAITLQGKLEVIEANPANEKKTEKPGTAASEEPAVAAEIPVRR